MGNIPRVHMHVLRKAGSEQGRGPRHRQCEGRCHYAPTMCHLGSASSENHILRPWNTHTGCGHANTQHRAQTPRARTLLRGPVGEGARKQVSVGTLALQGQDWQALWNRVAQNENEKSPACD